MRQHSIRALIVLLSCLLTEVGLFADEQYPLRRIEVEDGLSQNMVYSICQDNRGFMWFGTQDGLNRYDGSSFRIFRSGGRENLGNDGVLCMEEDSDGKLYVGTLQGLYYYDPMFESFTRAEINGKIRNIQIQNPGEAYVTVDDTSILKVADRGNAITVYSVSASGESIRSICFDEEGNLWAAGYGIGLLCINKDGHATPYGLGERNDMFTKVLCEDAENLLVGTVDNGILEFNLRAHSFRSIEGLDGSEVYFAHDILCDSKGRIWVGAENGLFIHDHDHTAHLTHIPNDPYSLADNAVFSLEEDNEGGIWIGTYFGGVNYYSEFSSQFRKYFPIPGYNNLKGKNISEFLETPDGNLWIGTEDAGLHRMNLSTGEIQTGFIKATNVHALADFDGNLWVGTYGDGLFIINRKSGASRNILYSKRGYSQREDNIYTVYRTVDGTIYLGTDSGLYECSQATYELAKAAPGMIESTVNDICQDFHGNLWVATDGAGVYFKDAHSGKWQQLGSSSKFITCILEDSRHDMWFGTEDSGMLHFSHITNNFDFPYTIDEGLPDEMVYMLLEDGSGHIWGSTNHGIFRANPENRRIIVFDHNSGLACDQYNYKSGVKTSDGGFFFGGVKGFVGFYPDKINLPENGSKIVFNQFLIGGRSAEIAAKNSPLEKAIIFTEKITLKQSDAVFSIGFADLGYALSAVRNYQYRMVGMDSNWYDVGKSHLITFSDLRHGKYRFEIKASSNVVGVSEAPSSITIVILPPWYLQWWALTIFSLIACAIVISVIYFALRAARKRSTEVLERMEREKEKELYDSKISFFTNITHEIRTPLTLITAPMEEIMEKTGKNNPAYEDLSIVKKNSERLLSLVNELLDFRRVESGNILPNFVKTDVVSVIKETLHRFQPRLDKEKLSLTCDLPDKLDADIDKDLFTKIISNILNNACKHAEANIAVRLEARGDKFHLGISNDGDKIPAKDAERIFDPFVKLDENVPGSGLGLAFARTLANTHGGDISLDLESTDTCFVVELPVTQKNVVISEIQDEVVEEKSTVSIAEDGRIKILVVDDNEDFRSFLSRKLGCLYVVYTADSGISAMEVLAKEYIDLIITDLMMPGMDGATFCASVKGDIRTSHIPVILVTAKSDMNTKLDCIKQGADDFIPKPFQMSYLLVRIENLIKSRENLIKSFRSSPEFTVSSIATSTKDEEFIERLKKTIDSRISDTDLDVTVLADSMNMSRATFYRKMKGFTEVSPNEFIRLYRLRKAAELLTSGKMSINEVAFAVGFSSSSYFSHCFSKQFGISPKDYASAKQLEK